MRGTARPNNDLRSFECELKQFANELLLRGEGDDAQVKRLAECGRVENLLDEIVEGDANVFEQVVHCSLVEAARVDREKCVVEIDGHEFDVLALKSGDDLSRFRSLFGDVLRLARTGGNRQDVVVGDTGVHASTGSLEFHR